MGTNDQAFPEASVDETAIYSDYDSPTFLRKATCDDPEIKRFTKLSKSASPQSYSSEGEDKQNEMARFIDTLDGALLTSTLPAVKNLPFLPSGISTAFNLLIDEGYEERAVLVLFLQLLCDSSAGANLSHQAKNVISKSYRELRVDKQTKRIIEERIKTEITVAEFDKEEFNIPTFLRKKGSHF